jgi:hypothetical protein
MLTFYAILNVRGRKSVETLETNFSTAFQIGLGKATRGVKGMQQVFRKRRGVG